ncbi:NAD-dependent succinate-semialdehyde dehydrogenase [Rouxiella badensis]|jgi:succinate-semialdehyde dehydrogenase|uniref:NAD-dependent succinate-semialdehyde dehydrogenase n=1 Tax=Rouxiella badensis TaxID=1646377 RepID=UPI001787CFED|nr:NAD-dependent succinate-semialdehyde dehydrogenase [Rouxiella badensis]QOI54961.1 NAD-dependent succinate-semialdehyde dehydrogenase [Rouxiella badensis subsp. acadiensis]WAT10487.1 NAD-dependent succinate-semialdehyde dehydrogenase [Rouxiella badensis]
MTNTTTAPAGAFSRNPTNGDVFKHYPFATAEEVDSALKGTQDAFNDWKNTDMPARIALLQNIARELRASAGPLAEMMTLEMGKPVTQALAEVEKSANLCEWYAQNGPAMLAPEPTLVENDKAWVNYLPLGPVLSVMPWNFPVWQVLRGAVPIILAGNSYLLKPAPNVMGCAYLLRDIVTKAGAPKGLFDVYNADNAAVAESIKDPRIAAITLTGSVRAGAAIASMAGAALKKCVMELGGSDAFIVLADADIDAAVKGAIAGRFMNNGQICISAKRIIVEESIIEEFTEKFLAAVKALKIGDPRDESTYLGPMARFDLRDELHGQVQATLAEGATLLLGGEPIEGAGNYYAPTVLGNVKPGMTSFVQELFGPVASLITAKDAADAVRMANDSEFGLGGSLWSRDLDAAKALAKQIYTGGMFINSPSFSDPRVPIGGVKKSGFGRELSHFGIREFTNPQTLWVEGL